MFRFSNSHTGMYFVTATYYLYKEGNNFKEYYLFCIFVLVDGEWSEWGNWSSCSVSCGNGTTTRKRLCNSPTPDNGGSDCLGNDTEYDTCMDEECTGWYKDIDIPMLFLFSKLTSNYLSNRMCVITYM